MEDEVLGGGNMTHVVRVGNTVRRSSGPWTPAVHALLGHLRSRGFERAPEALGIDDQGREIISLLPGTVATYPLPAHVLSDRTLVAVAQLLRDYHDATADFPPPANAQWRWPTHEPVEVLCHNDFAPYNLLFEGDQLSAVIDFDTASPGPRVWDLAYTAYRFVPLTDPANPDVAYPGTVEQRRRLALFVSSYGIATITSDDVVATTIQRLRELVDFIIDQARNGDPAQQAVLDRGDTVIYERDITYLEADQLAL